MAVLRGLGAVETYEEMTGNTPYGPQRLRKDRDHQRCYSLRRSWHSGDAPTKPRKPRGRSGLREVKGDSDEGWDSPTMVEDDDEGDSGARLLLANPANSRRFSRQRLGFRGKGDVGCGSRGSGQLL